MDEELKNDDMRSDFEAAMDALEAKEAPAHPGVEAAPVEAPTRDVSGKFAPVEPSKVEPVHPAAETTPTATPAAETPLYEKAPASWKPAIREKWAALDPEVRAEVARRESEMTTALNATAQSRRMAEDFQRVLQPHMPYIQAEGATPLQTIDNMLRTATGLRTSAPAQKAALIADIMQQFNVDVTLLDQQLTARMGGQTMQVDPYSQTMQAVETRLAPIQNFMRQLESRQQAQAAATQQSIQQEIDDFVTKAEFIDDVRQDVADILDLAANRGVKMSLQEAYNKAIMLHPQVSQVVAQRKNVQQATAETEAARRAKQASASLPSKGAPSQGREDVDTGDDVRSALLASMNRLSAQR